MAKPASRPSYPRFVPAALLPSGGFGDPDLRFVDWKIPRGTKPDKVALAQAQHRLACAVRLELRQRGMTETEMGRELGYGDHLFARRLNGNESMSTTDFVRIANAFGSKVIGALAESSQ